MGGRWQKAGCTAAVIEVIHRAGMTVVTRAMLATATGFSPDEVGQVLSRWRRQGIVEPEGRVGGYQVFRVRGERLPATGAIGPRRGRDTRTGNEG